MTVRVIAGDCLVQIAKLAAAGVMVDAIVTDPPYHLTSGNIAFDWANIGPGDKRPNIGQTNKSGRGHKTGFMGQRWDGGDIAFRPETWATIGQITADSIKRHVGIARIWLDQYGVATETQRQSRALAAVG